MQFPALCVGAKRIEVAEPSRLIDALWILIIVAVAAWAAWLTVSYIATELSWDEVAGSSS